MNRLIICVTVYQLFNAINLRLNMFDENDKCDIVLVDKTNFEKIYTKLKELDIFDNVYYVKSDKYYKDFFTKYFKNNEILKEVFLSSRIDMIRYKKMIKNYFEDTKFDGFYDELYTANYMRINNMLYNYIYDKNKGIKVFEYEDGVGSYTIPNEKFEKNNTYIKFLKMLGIKPLLPEVIEGLYLYNPSLYCKDDNLIKYKMPKFDKSNLKNVSLINEVFGYEKSGFFDRKYIIFEQSFKEDRTISNDVELISELIEKLGEENVIIKLHPRSKENRYEKFKGVKIYNESVPWEVIILNESFKDKILITISSMAILTPLIIFDEHCRAVLLFKLFKANKTSNYNYKILEYFNKIEDFYGEKFLFPSTMNELLMDLLNE